MSLITGLVITLLLGVAMSFWVVSAERQRRAVAAIEELYGWVVYAEPLDTEGAFKNTILRRILPRDFFDGVRQVYLTSSDATDDDLSQLQSLKGLRELYLDSTQIADAGLVHLQSLANLEILRLEESQVSEAGVAKLRRALPTCHIHGP